MESPGVAELADILRKLSPDDRAKLIEAMSDLAAEIGDGDHPHHPRLRNALGLSDDVALALFGLTLDYDMPPSELLKKALGLYKIAHDATAQGNRVAILNPDDEIEQEIVGIDTSLPNLHQPVG